MCKKVMCFKESKKNNSSSKITYFLECWALKVDNLAQMCTIMTISYVVIGHFVGTILNHYHPTLENV